MLAFVLVEGNGDPGLAPTAPVTDMNSEPVRSEILIPAQRASEELRSRIGWGPRQISLGIFLVIITVILLSIAIVGPVVASYGEETPEAYFAAAVATLLWDAAFVAIAFGYVRRAGGSWQSLGLRKPRSWPLLPLLAIAGYVLAFGSVLVYGLLVTVAGLDFLEPNTQIAAELFETPVVVAITGVAVVGGAPFAEEVLFRGFLFGGLRSRLSFWPAAFLSGFIFSLAHADPGFVVPFTAIGVILAFAYERTGTLATPIGVHLLFNSVSFLLLVFIPEAR